MGRQNFKTRLDGSSNEPFIRLQRINRLSRALGKPQRYLEIGVESGRTLFEVDIPFRVGVDPNPTFAEDDLPSSVQFWKQTSDEFFSDNSSTDKFGIVLVDGLHEWEQTLRDIMNAFLVLEPGGIIVVDDVLPTDKHSANADRSVAERAIESGLIDHDFWYGDTWKVLVAITLFYPEIGLGVMGNRSQRNHGQAFLWRNQRGDTFAHRRLTSGQIRELRDLKFEQYFDVPGVPSVLQRLRDNPFTYSRVARLAK